MLRTNPFRNRNPLLAERQLAAGPRCCDTPLGPSEDLSRCGSDPHLEGAGVEHPRGVGVGRRITLASATTGAAEYYVLPRRVSRVRRRATRSWGLLSSSSYR